jgi:hypothetical protein
VPSFSQEVFKMNDISKLASAVIASLVIFSNSAFAQKQNAQNMISSPSGFASAIQEMGYRAVLDKDDEGDPLIESSSGGSNFVIIFSECENNKDCQLLSFYKPFRYEKEDYAKVRALADSWNKLLRISSARVGEDTIAIAYSHDISGQGIPSENFKATFSRWTEEMDGLKDEIAKIF